VESWSGDESEFFSVCRRFSRPSTRLSKASRTSVLGPRFLGTASGTIVRFGTVQALGPLLAQFIP
jgi:hypothetical protein